MKKMMFFTAWMAFFCIPFLVNAQSPIDKIFDKYAGQDNFTTVNISKDMFEMFMQMDKEPGRDSGRVPIQFVSGDARQSRVGLR